MGCTAAFQHRHRGQCPPAPRSRYSALRRRPATASPTHSCSRFLLAEAPARHGGCYADAPKEARGRQGGRGVGDGGHRAAPAPAPAAAPALAPGLMHGAEEAVVAGGPRVSAASTQTDSMAGERRPVPAVGGPAAEGLGRGLARRWEAGANSWRAGGRLVALTSGASSCLRNARDRPFRPLLRAPVGLFPFRGC